MQAAALNQKLSIYTRGLRQKTSGAIMLPATIDELKRDFEIDTGNPQPILVDYRQVGQPISTAISWTAFQPPQMTRMDDASDYRIYRDPRVPPGTLRVTVTNRHLTDPVSFWLRQSPDRRTKEFRRGGSSAASEDVPTPSYPLNLEWAGHVDITPPTQPDMSTGWSLDWFRKCLSPDCRS